MDYRSRDSIESTVKAIIKRDAGNERLLVAELAELVVHAYAEGDYDGKKREQRRVTNSL